MLQVDEELEALISRIKLEEGNTEYWKRRFLGEGLNGDNGNAMDEGESESPDVQDYIDVVGDDAKEAEDDEADEDEEEEVEQIEEEIAQVENQDVERIKEKEVESKKPLQMIGVQLLKDSNEPSATSKKSSRRRSRRNMVDV